MEGYIGNLIGAAGMGIICLLIGKKRRIGGGWSFVLGFLLGIIGLIITLFSKRTKDVVEI